MFSIIWMLIVILFTRLFKMKFENEMRKMCCEWAEKGGEPFDILIAKDAKILFHDAFGEQPDLYFPVSNPKVC